MRLKVWRLNASGNIDVVGYGSCILPSKSGAAQIVSETWRPRGSPVQEAQALYLGVPPKLSSEDSMTRLQFSMLYTHTTGRVHISCETLMKNVDKLSEKS
eukprot:TRINITY_DN11329_c0_g1_i1.p4 TRINITY_DN11329_c0_g1~~TRINITY_DN11329_c0_g1_i1.p4  ORF type:complete len:100 (+),score=26.02 TRINITY_DN11329_c0_g1_i1:244-543(+)